PGSPPAGWSFDAGGTTYNCVPDGGTPAPHYTCPPVPPSPSATQSPAPPPSSPAPSATASPSGAPTLGVGPSPTPPVAPAATATRTAASTAAFVHPRGTPKPEAPALTLLPLELFPPPRRNP